MSFFCSFPFKHIQIGQTGDVMPCCAWQSNKKETLDTYFTSDQIKQVQQQLILNQVPTQCQRCHNEETRSGHSFRTLNQSFENKELAIRSQIQNYPHFEIDSVQILTSNICNLMCLPCMGSSYIRDVELKKLNLINYIPTLSVFDSRKDLSSLKSLKHISFLGGEPFADKITFQLIDQLIASGQSKQLRIDLNTNLTLVTKENLLKLRDNFQEVFIKGSIDGVGTVNEYLRYPSEWNAIEHAVDLILELEIPLVVTTALSNLALLKYDQLIAWAAQKGINDLFLSKVLKPSVLAFDHLPNKIKIQLHEKFINLRNQDCHGNRTQTALDACLDICSKTDKIHNMPTLITWLEKHDQLRGTNFRILWPELNDY